MSGHRVDHSRRVLADGTGVEFVTSDGRWFVVKAADYEATYRDLCATQSPPPRRTEEAAK